MNVTNLSCCGNCKHRSSIDMGDYFEETCLKGNHLESFKVCSEWEYDKMIYHNRKV